jgi:hypothetical protein
MAASNPLVIHREPYMLPVSCLVCRATCSGSVLSPRPSLLVNCRLTKNTTNAAIPATTGFVIEFLPVKSERGEDGGAQDQKIDQSRDNNIAVGEAAKST